MSVGKNRIGKSWSNPAFVNAALPSLREQAARGDPIATQNLNRLLEARPDLRDEVEEIQDLGSRGIKLWLKAIAGDDKLTATAIKQEIKALRAELLPDNPTHLETAVVNNLVLAHLANMYAALMSAKGTDKPALVILRSRMAESAQRRFQNALRTIALVHNKMLFPRGRGRPPRSAAPKDGGGTS